MKTSTSRVIRLVKAALPISISQAPNDELFVALQGLLLALGLSIEIIADNIGYKAVTSLYGPVALLYFLVSMAKVVFSAVEEPRTTSPAPRFSASARQRA